MRQMVKKTIAALFILALIFSAASCGDSENKQEGFAEKIENINVRKIDEVVITSGADGGKSVITDRDTIKELAEKAESLTFELNMDRIMTLGEMYTIKFMDGDEIVHQLSMDNEGIFWYDDTPGCYEKTGGEMDYEEVDRLFWDNYVEESTEAE